jgi:glucose 1-dehydrogenase
MCSNGRYTERGIKQVHGFMAERWRIEPEYVVRVDKDLGMLGVLLEPTTVVAKAWQQIAAIGQRTFWDPHTVLVVGAGPIGLLAALAGVHLGREVHVLDGSRPVRNRHWSSSWAPSTTPARWPSWGCTPTS